MQSGDRLKQSNINSDHPEPERISSNIKKAGIKFRKLLSLVMLLPDVISLKRNTPKTENIKKNKRRI